MKLVATEERRAHAMRKRHVREHGDGFELSKEAKRKLSLLAKKFEKDYGADAIIKIDEEEEQDLSRGGLSTGYQEIDDVLSGNVDKHHDTIPGTGVGVPKGRIIEIYGPESSGKTSLAILLAAGCQAEGETVGYVDVEHALDTRYCRQLGADPDQFLLTEPDTAEDALDQAEEMVRKGVNLVIVDSVAALVPAKEAKGGMGDAQMGSQARLMSQACRKLNRLLKRGGSTVIFINQTRQKIGVMFGDPTTTAGGNALKFYASIRASIKIIKRLYRKKEGADGERRQIGIRVKMETIKNKVAPPYRYVIYDMVIGKGVRVPSKLEVKRDKLEDRRRFGESKKK